jgi:2-succinyl-5-enolpyruvyl-6-hydroxy-3-cyclohexene-1-carboxylate synthase
VNPSTAFGAVLADELARCGLREVVVAPGSRSTPLAMAFWALDRAGRVRLHVRVDERSAAFTALGLAKASRRPVAVLCTSGTAAANFHPAVIEADESAVPLLVLTADRPPELRGTGASQTIDQVKLYGSAVRWYADAGVPERRPGMAGYWRSLACRAWAGAAGALGALPGPVHLNLPFRDPLVPGDASPLVAAATDARDNSNKRAGADGTAAAGRPAGGNRAAVQAAEVPGTAGADADRGSPAGQSSVQAAADGGAPLPGSAGPPDIPDISVSGTVDWPEPLAGREDGGPWTRVSVARAVTGPLELPWAERGIVVCGDGDYDAVALVELAERAGWPVLAEPSSGARRGPNALTGYQDLLGSPAFMAAHRPQLIISAGRPGLTRPQSALLGLARAPSGGPAAAPDGADGAARPGAGSAAQVPAVRHVVLAPGPGMWADPQRAATDVAAAIRLTGVPDTVPGSWLDAWRRADGTAVRAASAVLDAWHAGQAGGGTGAAASGLRAASAMPDGPDADAAGEPAHQPGSLSEPEVARELVAALPENAVLWCGNSLSVRDIDLLMPPRADTRVIASRGASGIDGTFSTAAGAALAHAAEHPGAVAFALIGDLSLLHDAPGLAIGPAEPRPDLCVVVVNNDGGGIFEGLEPARFKGGSAGGNSPSVFERVFGTAHGASLEQLAAAFGIPYTLVEAPGDLAKAMASALPGTGPRIIEARTGRAANADLRARMRAAAIRAVAGTAAGPS